MRNQALLLATGLAVAGLASAESQIGVFFLPHSEFDIGSEDSEGDGFGLHAEFDVWQGGRIDIDLTKSNYDKGRIAGDDNPDIDLRQIRIGYSFVFANSNSALSKNIRLETAYLSVDADGFSDSGTGYGVHAGLRYQASPALGLLGEVGYVDMSSLNGPEINLGVNYKLASSFSVFGQYRGTMLSEDGTDFDITDFRLGTALHF